MRKINYPYLPKNRKILYVKPDNKYMKEATKLLALSGCFKQPVSAVIIIGGKIIGKGFNASLKLAYCPREREGCKTGERYELCKIYCVQEGHAEVMAIKDALKSKKDLKGANIYIDGHWWCCKNCWDEMIRVGIKKVYLRIDSVRLYKQNIKIIDSGLGQRKIVDISKGQRKIKSEYVKTKLGAEKIK